MLRRELSTITLYSEGCESVYFEMKSGSATGSATFSVTFDESAAKRVRKVPSCVSSVPPGQMNQSVIGSSSPEMYFCVVSERVYILEELESSLVNFVGSALIMRLTTISAASSTTVIRTV